MKINAIIILFLLAPVSLNAQELNTIDSFKRIIDQNRGDTAEVNALAELANLQTEFDSTKKYALQGIGLAKKLNYRKGEADCLFVMARLGFEDLSEAIQNAISALNIYEAIDDKTGIASAHLILQGGFREIGDYRKALHHEFTGAEIAETNNVKGKFVFPGSHLAPLLFAEASQTYLMMNELDSASIYARKAIAQNELFFGAKWNFPIYLLANIQDLQGNYDAALAGYRSAIPLAIQNQFFHDTLQIFSGMSTLFINIGQIDSSIHYASMVERSRNPERETKTLLEAINNLYRAYKLKGNKDSALKYTELNYTLKDSIFSREKEREIQNIAFNERLKQQEIIAAQDRYKSKIQFYALAAGLFALLLVAGLLWRNNMQKQKAKNKIEKAYAELKSAQTQLVQREKMASLGELTAGIAHEIQNPLNFINNFSEVNNELIDEMQLEMAHGTLENAKAISNNIKENEEKINLHGKRADSIVKAMLQHSRTSSGQKEPTDINALADEYLRLSYHGIVPKDKSFNAIMQTDFDKNIGNISIIPQDIGRVMLNLYNNAFQSMLEKSKLNQVGYDHTISVTTRKLDGKVIITVKDNGTGIPEKIKDKIFQPFFTTKPAGSGTGLGLSLSYDIITKEHGGEIKVESKEGEGAEFIISLPV